MKSIFNGRDRKLLAPDIKDTLEFLEKENKNTLDSKVVFDEGPHTYHIGDNKVKISCTGWSKSYFFPFNKERVVAQCISKAKNNTSHKYYGMSKEGILKLWDDNGKESRDKGTLMHAHIEYEMNNYKSLGPIVEWDYTLQDECRMYHEFWNLYGEHITPFRTEWVVFDKELSVAGSVDMVFESTGPLPMDNNMSMPNWAKDTAEPKFKDGEKRYYIFDWKRSKEIKFSGDGSKFVNPLPGCNYSEYSIQLNIYRYMLEKNYGIRIAGMVLVVFHPEFKNYKTYKVPFLDNHLNEMIETRKKNLELIDK